MPKPRRDRRLRRWLAHFLMRELSEKEDCDSLESGIPRLDTAIRELQEVRSAFIEANVVDLQQI